MIDKAPPPALPRVQKLRWVFLANIKFHVNSPSPKWKGAQHSWRLPARYDDRRYTCED